MKACRVCGRLYPGEARFCPIDGQGLYSATEVPVPSDDADPRIGQLMLERYQLRRVVADGGMGRVYEALDTHERRHVALKILHQEVARDEVAVERFKREFEVSQELPSVHMVEVLDFRATTDGSYVLVMEFLYGEELRATLRREQQLEPARLVRLLSQVALGLDEAHAKDLVHRDLKPDNLFLCQTSSGDMVKVLDFGSVRDNAASAKKLTVLGTTIGSPFYMAPEQAQGLPGLDRRADVWSLGAIAYECLTGSVPFQGANGPSVLLEILTKEPAAPSRAAELHGAAARIPRRVDAALLRALRKSAARRTPTAGQLADEVGAGFGLEGAHATWAATNEAELARRIGAQLPALLEADAQRGPPSASEAFFGDLSGLGLSDPPGPRESEPVSAGERLPAEGYERAPGTDASAAGRSRDASTLPPLVPSQLPASLAAAGRRDRSRWLAPVIVAVVALTLGVLLVLLLA
jgi:serine/threonine protein kinase